MKITKAQLKQIIKEELEQVLKEQPRYSLGFSTDFGPGSSPHQWRASAGADVPGIGGATIEHGSAGPAATGRFQTPVGQVAVGTRDPERAEQALQHTPSQLTDDPIGQERAREGETRGREELASRLATGFRPQRVAAAKPKTERT